MYEMNHVIREAMQLMRTGDLHAATRAIQRGLAHESAWSAAGTEAGPCSCFDGEYRVLERDAEAPPVDSPGLSRERVHEPPGLGTFTAHRFRCAAGTMQYKLFVPAGIARGAPLIVMLHGCTQSPDDFARGTRMNTLAREHGYVVAYPAQAQSRNANRCWNWFRSEDQQRDAGEPGVIAALTRHLVEEHGLDARRVFAAGLSAGGAMAAVLAGTYADVYAAIGVHSGLPFGAARDLTSAFAAMKHGGATGSIAEPVPAIVFHGDGDGTVDPRNGHAIIAQVLGNREPEHVARRQTAEVTVEHGSVPQGRTYTRTLYRNDFGVVVAEHWEVHGAGHAWFGGDPSGSYTDATGPDASAHMLRFFRDCTRDTVN